jgi:hypothetical protein
MIAEQCKLPLVHYTQGKAESLVCWILALSLCHLVGCGNGELPQDVNQATVRAETDVAARIAAFCGDCHALPRPESFPRDYWYTGVKRGYEFYARSGRSDLDPPEIQSAVDYYRSRAPERFSFSEPLESIDPPPTRFRKQPINWSRDADEQPAIAHLKWARLRAGADPVLLACDMRDGTVAAFNLSRGSFDRRVLATLAHPCHIEPCDLEGNGRTDLIVADLGSFLAEDHDRGRVIWLRPHDEGDGYEEVVLASGLGRVADVRPVDVDGDGRLELLVAEFGARRGSMRLLRNLSATGEAPRFESETIDSRPGTIHMLPYDFNGDGRLDFAALVSQHYETVDLFLNKGRGQFQRHPVWWGPDLAFGSSGISLADVNQDGRIDILYTNGDAFDNAYANPNHGVQWLENLGDLKFAYHRIIDLPGAYHARSADFDLDGRQDIIATAWLPREVLPVELRTTQQSSVVLLSQTSAGGFARHTLEADWPYYAALEVADFDNDGAPDFAVGSHTGTLSPVPPDQTPIVIWWNSVGSEL